MKIGSIVQKSRCPVCDRRFYAAKKGNFSVAVKERWNEIVKMKFQSIECKDCIEEAIAKLKRAASREEAFE